MQVGLELDVTLYSVGSIFALRVLCCCDVWTIAWSIDLSVLKTFDSKLPVRGGEHMNTAQRVYFDLVRLPLHGTLCVCLSCLQSPLGIPPSSALAFGLQDGFSHIVRGRLGPAFRLTGGKLGIREYNPYVFAIIYRDYHTCSLIPH